MLENIKVTKQDVIWSYFAYFFLICSNIIILPMVLKKLSAEEVGMNYLMLSVGQLVALVDFGFSPQFARNVTYVYSGAQRLLKNGLDLVDQSKVIEINYSLLATLIQTARWVYRLIGGIVLFFMLTLGTGYISVITEGFSNVRNSWIIWLIYSISVFFQIYYSYYSILLTGSGKIVEGKRVQVYSNVIKIVLSYILLYFGYGLLGIVTVNLIYSFMIRYLSYHYYFTKDLKKILADFNISNSDKKDLFNVLWLNSKKLGLITFAGFLSNGASNILAGLYLPLKEVASYGLMMQIVGIIGSVSGIMLTVYQPRLSSLRISDNMEIFRKEISYTMFVFYLLYFIGVLLLVLIVPKFIFLIDSNIVLPSISLILLYAFFRFLDCNFWNLCQSVIIGNEFPFLKSCMFSGLGIIIGCYVSLSYFHLGLWGIVLSTGLAQSLFNNWYWPHKILKSMNISSLRFFKDGYLQFKIQFINL